MAPMLHAVTDMHTLPPRPQGDTGVEAWPQEAACPSSHCPGPICERASTGELIRGAFGMYPLPPHQRPHQACGLRHSVPSPLCFSGAFPRGRLQHPVLAELPAGAPPASALVRLPWLGCGGHSSRRGHGERGSGRGHFPAALQTRSTPLLTIAASGQVSPRSRSVVPGQSDSNQIFFPNRSLPRHRVGPRCQYGLSRRLRGLCKSSPPLPLSGGVVGLEWFLEGRSLPWKGLGPDPALSWNLKGPLAGPTFLVA